MSYHTQGGTLSIIWKGIPAQRVALRVGGLLNILFTVMGTILFPGNAPTNTLWVPVQLFIFSGIAAGFNQAARALSRPSQADRLARTDRLILTFLTGLLLGIG